MSIKIMIVDDDQISAGILAKRLKKRGFLLEIVSSGKECLQSLQNDIPDIILLDLVMPEMNGFEVLFSIRLIYSAIDIPIIMVTAKNDVADIVEALQVGANDYMEKPINLEIVEARINAQINAVRNYRDAIDKKELESINTLIATYNHEINNPLTIAYGLLRKSKKEQTTEYLDKIGESLQRVAKIVKEIEKIVGKTSTDSLEITQKMYKIR